MSASDNLSKWWDAAFFLFTVRTCQKGIMPSARRIEHKPHFKGITDLFWRWLKPAASCDIACLFFSNISIYCACFVCFFWGFITFIKLRTMHICCLFETFPTVGQMKFFLFLFSYSISMCVWFLKSNWTYSPQERTYVPGSSQML